MKEKKEIKIRTILLTILALLFLVVGVLAVSIYAFNLNNRFISKMEEFFPFPAAIVESKKIVSIAEFSQNAESVKRFYENQDFSKMGLRVDFSTPDGQKRLTIRKKEVLGKMIEDEAILILAEKEGIKITAQNLADNVDKKLEEYGNRNSVEGELQRLYGWTIEDFKQKIVLASLYREELTKVFEKKYQNSEVSRKKIDEAAASISKREKSFADVAAQFSEGSTADTGGELGWFKKEQISPEIVGQIFSLKVGEISSVLESPLGFHIVQMEEKKKDGETEMVRISQVFSAKKTFSEWIGEQMKTMKIRVWLKDYVWNNEKMQLDFSAKEMRDFEEQVMKDPQGDASVIF
jgi:hypothetical protein